MNGDDVKILFEAHKAEIETGKMLHRKGFVSRLGPDMDIARKRRLIRAFQDNYFERLKYVGLFRLD